jgi:hypothetical protein
MAYTNPARDMPSQWPPTLSDGLIDTHAVAYLNLTIQEWISLEEANQEASSTPKHAMPSQPYP